MNSLNLQSIKTASLVKDTDEKRRDTREKAMLLFAYQLLLDKGYLDTANVLASECSLSLDQYAVCENIDLNSIFVEYEAYYSMRFNRPPQYFKKLGAAATLELQKQRRQTRVPSGRKPTAKATCFLTSNNTTSPNGGPNRCIPEAEDGCGSEFPMFVQGSSSAQSRNSFEEGDNHYWSEKLLKPISDLDFGGSEDAKAFAYMIQKEIVIEKPETKWQDVVGLDDAKTVLQEALVLQHDFRDFFGSALPPWKALLLYGPPGNGKTLLARAAAAECKTTFFNVSSATIVSKWRGDSEKIVKILFQLARHHAPSTIFFDEFDALGSKRGHGETDACRRLKSEILQQLDGLNSIGTCQIFVLAATNLPWDIDVAMLRRFDKRVLVPLPDDNDRKEMFHLDFARIADKVGTESKNRSGLVYHLDLDYLSQASEGCSGSDIRQIVKESLIRKFREKYAGRPQKLTLTTEDVLKVINDVPPTCDPELMQRYRQWGNRLRM